MSELSFDLERVARELNTLAEVVAISLREGQTVGGEQEEQFEEAYWASRDIFRDFMAIRRRSPKPSTDD